MLAVNIDALCDEMFNKLYVAGRDSDYEAPDVRSSLGRHSVIVIQRWVRGYQANVLPISLPKTAPSVGYWIGPLGK